MVGWTVGEGARWACVSRPVKFSGTCDHVTKFDSNQGCADLIQVSTWIGSKSASQNSYLRLIDFVYHSTLGLAVIKKKRRTPGGFIRSQAADPAPHLVSGVGGVPARRRPRASSPPSPCSALRFRAEQVTGSALRFRTEQVMLPFRSGYVSQVMFIRGSKFMFIRGSFYVYSGQIMFIRGSGDEDTEVSKPVIQKETIPRLASGSTGACCFSSS